MSNEVIPYERMERMAMTAAKSGLFGKDLDQTKALALMMIAAEEGISPIKAVMEYDIINGRPALKAYAMLGRFQKAGGTVEWLEASDEKVTGKFEHPAGGTITVTWDTARVQAAGLMRNALHKTNPQQMKRARCISEGIRAVYPSCTPMGVYTTEETEDIAEQQTPVNSASTEAASVSAAVNKLPDAEAELFKKRIESAPDTETLRVRYAAAYQSAKEIGDEVRMSSFKTSYDWRLGELTQPAAERTDEARGTDGEVI